jgi:hypothetical protein
VPSACLVICTSGGIFTPGGIFASEPANQAPEDAHDVPEVWPPTPAVRAKRAFCSAPVVLVRGVRMPADAESGASIAL